MVNIQLLVKTYNHIAQNPGEWNQRNWRCNTGMCFGGHASVLAGYQFARKSPDTLVSDIVRVPVDMANTHIVPEDHPDANTESDVWKHSAIGSHFVPGMFVSDLAEKELGLDDCQAEDLFSALNTLDDLRHYVADLTGLTPDSITGLFPEE